VTVRVLPNYVWKRWVLRYDDGTGTAQEEQSDETHFDEGYYVNMARDLPLRHDAGHDDFAGFSVTDEGALFFRNDFRMGMEDGACRAVVSQEEGIYRFTLWSHEEERLSFIYPGPPQPHSLWALGEDVDDFFQWLAQHLHEPGFLDGTIPLPLDAARQALDAGISASGADALDRCLDRYRGAARPEQRLLRRALLGLLSSPGERREQELAARVLEQVGMWGLERRLAQAYEEHGWDSGHPLVRAFDRHRQDLPEKVRGRLRRLFLADPQRHHALAGLSEPDPPPEP
jgi:hypothetical protein